MTKRQVLTERNRTGGTDRESCFNLYSVTLNHIYFLKKRENYVSTSLAHVLQGTTSFSALFSIVEFKIIFFHHIFSFYFQFFIFRFSQFPLTRPAEGGAERSYSRDQNNNVTSTNQP